MTKSGPHRRTDRLFKMLKRGFIVAKFKALRRSFYQPLADSALFDADYYLQQNPDVAAAKIDPLQHFIIDGHAEGRNPNPWFHTQWYKLHYPDVVRKRRNALADYAKQGAQKGRDPSPWFNTVEYLLDHPGLVESGVN